MKELKNYPEVTVGALILNKKGDVLLVRSPKWLGGKLSVPGGHINYCEKAYDAIVREVKEEVGIKVKPVELLAVQDVILPEEFYDHSKHFIFLDFLCEAITDDVKVDRKEISEYIWVNPEEALSMDIEKYTRRLIKIYLKWKGRENPSPYFISDDL